MKIKRFFAPDMRQAIRQVREAFGPDAVILSNKGVDGGVELVAAMDYDESSLSGPEESAASISELPRPGCMKSGEDFAQRGNEFVALGVSAYRDAQVLVDARHTEMAHDDAAFTQGAGDGFPAL